MSVKLKCIAVDDEPLALELIEHYVSNFSQLHLVQKFEDAISGAQFLKENTVDLLFVDINMPDISGLELVRALDKPPMIIFTTAYKNFAFEGFELNALDFLLKPIELLRFKKTVQKAIDHFEAKEGKAMPRRYLYVYVEYRLTKVELEDIQYIESLEDYIRIHLNGQKPLMTLMSLKSMQEKLPDDAFIRIHRSYIVPVQNVSVLHHHKVVLKSGTILPVGPSYATLVKNRINEISGYL